MYTWKDNVLCIPASALYEDLNIITYTTYGNYTKRKKINVVQKGGNGRKALVAFESLPMDWRQLIKDRAGKPPGTEAVSMIEKFYNECYDECEKMRLFYETYRLPDGRPLGKEAVEGLIANALMLESLRRTINDTKSVRASRGGSGGVCWDNLINTLKMLKLKKVNGECVYNHTLPLSERHLRGALQRMEKEGLKSLIKAGKYGNKNSVKVKTDEQELLLQELFGNGRNLDDEFICEMYNATGRRLGWEPISIGTVRRHREKLKRITEPGRRGKSHYNNTMAMQVKRSKPTAPLYFWTADGWTAELLYKKTTVNKQGYKSVTYHNRLTIVVILDMYNEYPVGYAIGDGETPELIKEAMRDALNHTKKLFGQRYQTWQVQSDNYAKKNLTDYWTALADKWTPASVGNSKAKPVEPWFCRVLQKKCRVTNFPNWSGYGVTSKKDNQVNAEWLDANKHNFPDREGCRQQLITILEECRATALENFKEAFFALSDDDKLPLTDEQYLYKFGMKTLPNRLEGQGLTPKIGGVERFYDSFDLNFRNYGKERWVIHYDPADMTAALAVAEGREELRFALEAKYVQPMALKDRQEGDGRHLERVRAYNKEDREMITERRKKGAEVVENLMSRKELDGGILSKLMITDSKGQHKKHLYEKAETVDFEPLTTNEEEYLKSKVDFEEFFKK